MGKINVARVVVGGLVAGLVMNLIDFLVNGVLLAAQWKAGAAALSPKLDVMASSAIAGYVVLDLGVGLLTVWLYAAIRPRLGAGPKTAMMAGFVAWLFNALYSSILATTGLYAAGLVCTSVGLGLVSALAGAYVGAMLYRED